MFYTVVVSMGRWSCLHLLRCFQLYETARHWLMLHGLGGWWQFCCLWLVISLFSMPVWTKFGREKYRREFASRYVIVQSMMVMRLHHPNLLHSMMVMRLHFPNLLHSIMVMRLHLPQPSTVSWWWDCIFPTFYTVSWWWDCIFPTFYTVSW